MILLVIDVQKLIMTDDLYDFARFEDTVGKLICAARESGTEVIYVRHDDGEGEELTKGKAGFEIYDGFKPQPGEKIFTKTVNSCFKESGLLEYLREKQAKEVAIAGLMTDYCIDATVKCGFEHGFSIIVPKHANTTTDNEYMTGKQTYEYYNGFIWQGRYAHCISPEETIERMKR
mgnify:FL=1